MCGVKLRDLMCSPTSASIMPSIRCNATKPARSASFELLNTSGFRLKAGDRQRVLELAREFDLVWIHTVWTANALDVYRLDQPTVLDADERDERSHEHQ